VGLCLGPCGGPVYIYIFIYMCISLWQVEHTPGFLDAVESTLLHFPLGSKGNTAEAVFDSLPFLSQVRVFVRILFSSPMGLEPLASFVFVYLYTW